MAGSTNNSNLLTALNQAVKAINDLIIGTGTTVVEAPNVTVRPNITINCSCGGAGTKLEDPPVSETDPPPAGYEPDPNIDQRKCKAANYVYGQIIQFINRAAIEDWDDIGVGGITGAFTLATALLGFALGNVLGAVVGAVAGMVIGLIAGIAIQLDDISSVMEAKKSELICALYNATDTTTAKNDFLSVLADGGLISAEIQSFMAYFLYSDVLKVLFQAVDWVSEATIGAADGSNCGGCGGGDCLPQPRWGDMIATGSYVDISTINSGGNNTFWLWWYNNGVACNRRINISILEGGILGGDAYYSLAHVNNEGQVVYTPRITTEAGIQTYLDSVDHEIHMVSISYNWQVTKIRCTYV